MKQQQSKKEQTPKRRNHDCEVNYKFSNFIFNLKNKLIAFSKYQIVIAWLVFQLLYFETQ
jgi:hypothetical protein